MTQLLTAKQMRDSDARAIGGNEEKSRELMYLASLGVYNNVKWHGKIAVVVGKGNNGGDGYSLALILKENNLDCDIIAPLGEPKKDSTAYYYFIITRNEFQHKYNRSRMKDAAPKQII